MKKRIFRGILLVAVIVWAFCVGIMIKAVYTEYNGETVKRLEADTGMIAKGVELSGTEYLQGITLDENTRVTLIEPNGKVIYDSKADPAMMENHAKRPEIKKALKSGTGTEERYSHTLSEKNIYYAKCLDDGSVLRLSLTKESFFVVVAEIMKLAAFVLIVAVIAGTLLADTISRKIVKPLYELDMDNPKQAEVYDEIKPLVEKIDFQNKMLKSKINRLQIDVNEKTQEAEFRKEFTANVSHELKTPLTSISGFAELIKNGMVKEEDLERFAGRIYDEAQRLMVLVEDIIKLSQLDEKQVAAIQEHLDLYTVCEEQINILKVAAEKNNVDVRIRGKHLYVTAVKQILDEMIYNICDNAIKYNKPGGFVEISVFSTEDNNIALSVTDSGIGIPEEDLEHVFERFFRVDKSHSKKIGGTGLGLSIVKHAAAFLGASVQIDSALGEGTKITVIFNKQ